MSDMNKIAKDFQNKHKKGTVSNITNYSFQYKYKKKLCYLYGILFSR